MDIQITTQEWTLEEYSAVKISTLNLQVCSWQRSAFTLTLYKKIVILLVSVTALLYQLKETIGIFANGHYGSSENLAKNINNVLSDLNASIWICLIFQMQGIFPGVEFLRTLSRFKRKKEKLFSNVHVLHKMLHQKVSRHTHAVNMKEMN